MRKSSAAGDPDFYVLFRTSGCRSRARIKAFHSWPISINVSAFLQQAEDILDVAVVANDPGAHDVAILLDREGGMRMRDAAGWSLPAMSAEFGATAVYKVERRGGTV